MEALRGVRRRTSPTARARPSRGRLSWTGMEARGGAVRAGRARDLLLTQDPL